MDEEAELKARIAALAGRINQHKQAGSAPLSPVASKRWSPYGGHAPYQPTHPRGGRGGGYYRGGHAPTHRNMSLVVNNTADKNSSNPATPSNESGPSNAGWVSTRNPGNMQLTNVSVYDQKIQQKKAAMEETARAKKARRNQREKQAVIKHFNSTPGGPVASAAHEITINNLRFRLASDGSKLIRIFDPPNNDPKTTPKQATVAGITFHRSKNGNLYRHGVVKKNIRETPVKSAKLCPRFTSTGTKTLPAATARGASEITKSLDIRMCSLGPKCHYTHDINKLAICPDFLRQGHCAAGEEACHLSHIPSPHRVPACIHFIRGNCTKPDCRYAHIRVNPSAPVCRDFAVLGYCDKGDECTERHVHECPSYANTGVCRNKACRLPHVDTAANMRKAATAAAAGKPAEEDDNDSSDLSSDEEDYEEIGSDDVDSDDLDEDFTMTGTADGHEMSQQQDFIAFR